MGKGSLQRPYDTKKYEQNYERIFGKKCTACEGRGYHLDRCELTKKMLKTTCIFCKGTGKC